MTPLLRSVGLRRYAQAWIDARLLPVRLAGADLSGALRLAEAPPRPGFDGMDPDLVASLTHAVTRRPLVMRRRRCLRSGLLGYKYLRMSGHAPVLHFALAPDSLREPATRAHCWVTLEGRPVINDPDPAMVEVMTHPAETAR